MDLYNFGVSIYEIMTGKVKDENIAENYNKQREDYEAFKETKQEIRKGMKKTFTVEKVEEVEIINRLRIVEKEA